MGDGRYDSAADQGDREHAQRTFSSTWMRCQAERRMHQRGHARRRRRTAAACRSRPTPSRRRSAPTARRVDAQSHGFRAGLEAPGKARRPARRSKRPASAAASPRWPNSSARSRRDAGGARYHRRRGAPARRLSGRRLCAALSRPLGADPPRRRARAQGRQAGSCARPRAHLAVRMSYEDVIRVAQAKIEPARL